MKTEFTTTTTRVSSHSTFRLFLQAELARRCSTNPQYSLRSFALQLKIDQSTLSQILRGKRLLSGRVISKLGKRLALDSSTIDAFILQERLRSAEMRSAQGEIRQLAHDTVSLISNVYHYTILELIRLPEFKTDSRWIARVLNLSIDEVNLAIARLLRLGLLEMVAVDKWVDKSGLMQRLWRISLTPQFSILLNKYAIYRTWELARERTRGENAMRRQSRLKGNTSNKPGGF